MTRLSPRADRGVLAARSRLRANDGHCDRQCHFVFGTMDEAGGTVDQGR
jgi:sugar lactone lactonase YvrE